MTREQELLAAILAFPEDEAARLVYADFLLERGDPRGEFIHVQCALGRPAVGGNRFWLARVLAGEHATREELEAHAARLLKKHQKTWLAPIRPFINAWRFSRGFVEAVEADSEKLVAGLAAILAETPLLHAKVTARSPGRLLRLAELEPLRGLRSLSLAATLLGVRQARLLHSANLCNLHALDLSVNWRFDDACAAILAEAKHLDALTELDLSGTHVTRQGFERLGAASFFPRLRTLGLARLGLGDGGLEQLLDSPLLGDLEELELAQNGLGEPGALALARAPHLGRLRKLSGIFGNPELGANTIRPKSKAARLLRQRFAEVS